MDAPYTQRRAAQFRGPSTSDDYNRRIEENYKDLVLLFNRARLSEVELDEMYRRIAKDHISMVRVIEDLEQRIDTLEADAKRFTFYSIDQIDNEAFDPLNYPTFWIPEEDRLSLDTQHGILTLPKIDTSSLSRLFFTDSDGFEVLPPTLETRVVADEDSVDNSSAFVESSEPEFALLSKPGLIWERNVVVDASSVEGAALTLYIKVPTDLFTTDRTNAVVAHSFPYFGTSIQEIAYTLHHDPTLRDSDGYVQFNSGAHYAGEDAAKGWVIPGGWGGIHEGEDAAVNTGPRIYYFDPKPITALRIKLHQDTFYRQAGKFVYSYGLTRLDLRYDKFLADGKALIRFDAPDGETISSVNDVQPQIWNVSPALLSQVFDYRVIWETNPDSGVPTEDPQPNSKRVWIEVALKDTQGWTPALSGLIVDYS